MEIFNVGPLEFLLIVILALIVLGPNEMTRIARSSATWIRRFLKSSFWVSLRDTSREIQALPTRMVREAGLEEDMEQVKKDLHQPISLDGIEEHGGKLPENQILPDTPGQDADSGDPSI